MLYDRTREHGTLAHFAAWLATQPPDARYDFGCTLRGDAGCAVSRYLATVSRKSSPEMFLIYVGRDPGQVVVAPPHTYGAALARARRALDAALAAGQCS